MKYKWPCREGQKSTGKKKERAKLEVNHVKRTILGETKPSREGSGGVMAGAEPRPGVPWAVCEDAHLPRRLGGGTAEQQLRAGSFGESCACSPGAPPWKGPPGLFPRLRGGRSTISGWKNERKLSREPSSAG